ncbi:MAG: hypothetical protein JRI68_22305 [Deltaproteobacteria bacterium]|nr:hypothetical protein [Deltaproteobacteria bacterium]
MLKLPKAGRAGWVLMALVGLALMGLGGVDIAVHAPALTADPRTLSFLALGAGLFLAFFTVAVLANRETASALRIDPQARVITIESQDGASVDFPFGAIESVACHPAAGSGGTQVLALAKRDGGMLELAAFGDDEQAKEAVSALRRALGEGTEDAPGEDGAERSGSDPAARLTNARAVATTRSDDRLTLRWSARGSMWSLAAVGCFGGLAVISYAFVREGHGSAIVAVGFMVALAVLMVAANLYSLGLRLQVSLDSRHLIIERLRFGRSTSRQAVPLFSIVAVDYTHQLSTSGAGLTIRTGKGQDDREDALAEAEQAGANEDDPLTGAKVGLALMKLVQSGIHIPAGKLSLATKIALELTIGEEIARRTGKRADQL